MEDEDKDEEFDWSNYGDFERQGQVDLEGQDILAICIASLQTIFLPLLILTAFLLVVGILMGLIL
ncbi:MAG: hypothetical protein ACFFCT_03530 [Candidatus Odinarchaeota archaeon]|nr:hypothetical protein [Candidatus Thorarchaeota archaeon]